MTARAIEPPHVAAARADERTRIATVLASEAAAGRERIAARLLADSDMPAERIIAMLPEMEATSGAARSMLSLLGQGNPEIRTR